MTWGNPPKFQSAVEIISADKFIVTRKDARASGAKHYFTAIPCNYGHIDIRYTSNDVCRTCARTRSRDYGRKNIAKIVNRFKERIYGITPEQFADMVWKQGNKCLVCEEQFQSEKAPHLDHCHDTGNIRGILCHRCNTGLGLFKDNIGKLEKAIAYLRKYQNGMG